MRRAAIAFWACLLIPGSIAAAPKRLLPVLSTNVGLETLAGAWAEGHLVAAAVPERWEGLDLNGDGDLLDNVLHVYDASSGKLTNLRLDLSSAIWAPILGDDFVIFRVPEYETGEDVDGDGRLWGYVVYVFDVRSQTVVNLEVPAPRSFLAVGRSAAFWDPTTRATMVYDVDHGVLRNLGLPAQGGLVSGTRVLFRAVELWAGSDLNGDGDLDDGVLHVLDLKTGAVENTGLELGLTAMTGDWAVFVANELADGVDRNGDGDALDSVVGVYNAVDGRRVNTGLAVRPAVDEWLKVTDGRLWLRVSEASQGGQDLNGDGDALDYVLWLYDPATDSSLNTGQEASPAFEANGLIAAFHGVAKGASHLFVFDATARRLRDLGRSSGYFGVGRDFVHFFRWEELWGDLNHDGDTRDHVAHVYDAGRDRVINLGVDARRFFATSDWLYLEVNETSQGADLDRNGDRRGTVFLLYHVPSHRLLNTTKAARLHPVLTHELFVFEATEWSRGIDLNGDGDTADSVLQVVSLRPAAR